MQHLRIRLSATLSNKAAPNQPTHAVIKAAGRMKKRTVFFGVFSK